MKAAFLMDMHAGVPTGNSPDTFDGNLIITANGVYKDGNVSVYGYTITNSYGIYLSPGPGYDNDYVYMYVIYPGAYTDSVSVVYWDSCGQSSPDVNNNYHILSCYIESDGTSSNDFFYGDNVTYSYGALRASTTVVRTV